MEEGSIIIDPFRPENLATSSYDVTLGAFFYREQPPKHNHFIYNMYSESHMRHVWGADRVEEARTAEEEFQKLRFNWEGIEPEDQVIVLKPGETILAHTQEFIGGKDHVTTMMKARSSMGRNFIQVCKCAGWGDVGFINRWTMEISNMSRHYAIPIVVGRRIAQIVFFETGPIRAQGYAAEGKYQSAADLATTKANWRPDLMLPRLYKDREIAPQIALPIP